MESRLSTLEAEILSLQDEESLFERVVSLFQELVNAEIDEALTSMESLLTQGMQAVFDDMDLSVSSDVGVERGKVAVNLRTKQSTGAFEVEGATTDSFGQSVATVQSILLRVLVIMRRNLRPFLVLDEALPAFDPNYVGNMGEFLSSLCSKLGLDILMVTHNPVLVESADQAYLAQKKVSAVEFQPIR